MAERGLPSVASFADVIDDDEGAFADAAATFNEALDDQVLKDNWRSGNKIVDWNNGFFDAMQSRLPVGLHDVYKDHRQDARKAFEGQVRVEVIHDADKDTRKGLLSDALIRRLRHHKSAAGGGFAWADMAVLVRTNKQGALLAQHMLNEGITPQTEDSLHVGRHPAALAVIALTRWVVDPNENGMPPHGCNAWPPSNPRALTSRRTWIWP